jgi:hypothetical protein
MIDKIEKLTEQELVKLHNKLKHKKKLIGLSDKEQKQYENIKDVLWIDYRL